MQYIGMAVFGLIVGYIARFLYPGAQHMNILYSMLLGVAGSFLAGIVGGMIHKPADGKSVHAAGFIYSVIGALALIFIARRMGLV